MVNRLHGVHDHIGFALDPIASLLRPQEQPQLIRRPVRVVLVTHIIGVRVPRISDHGLGLPTSKLKSWTVNGDSSLLNNINHIRLSCTNHTAIGAGSMLRGTNTAEKLLQHPLLAHLATPTLLMTEQVVSRSNDQLTTLAAFDASLLFDSFALLLHHDD